MVTAVMRGFESAVHEKMQGIHAQAIISSSPRELDFDAIEKVIKEEFPSVIALSPHASAYAIVQPENAPKGREETPPTVIMLKGIDPEKERTVSSIENKLVVPANLHDTVHDNHVIIGKTMAADLGLEVGSPIQIIYMDQPGQSRKVTLHTTTATVSGIFNSGIDEFDSSLVLCSLDFLRTLFPDNGITHINIKIEEKADEEAVINRLRERLSLDVYSWKELYPALVSALKLEKYAMFLVLVLITLVASMNIISLLFMLITQKRADIAILRAMGVPASVITHIFMLIGIFITSCASVLGLALAALASWVLEHYPFIELPDVYYVSHLPAKMEWSIILAVFVAVMIISIIATYVPARRTRSIVVADVLRFEG